MSVALAIKCVESKVTLLQQFCKMARRLARTRT